jgi:transposase-like protein
MASAGGLRRAIKGLSEAEFRERFGTEEACREALFGMRWREGLSCPACGGRSFCQLRTRRLFQCNRCKRQVRLTAGTVFQDTKLPLTTWFVAIYHLTQSKGGISSIELGRRLGVKQGTAWPMKHKLRRAMAEREAAKPKLAGRVEVDPPVPLRGPEGRLPTSAASARAASGAGAPPARRRSWPPWRPRPSASPGGCG